MRLLILTLLTVCATAFAGEMFSITKGSSSNHISFTSDAPLEEVVGKTNDAAGFIMLPDDTSPGSAEVHVELATLSTGLSLRDKHMRENHLETDKYPQAVFKMTALEIPGGKLTDGQKTPVTVKGTLTLHGVEKEITPMSWLTLNGDQLSIESKFSVGLKDYNIERPEFLVMKLADEQRVEVKLVAERSQ
ncbi:MAG: YceI family protein [Calditrichaeota bacterium]|nr:YceI family protein [Calditrichota bacterium]MCB9367689.1 YceI family protein [Calditrichota bacterium]